MIKLTPNPTFKAPVLLTVPGLAEPVQLEMTFRHMPADQANEWIRNNQEKHSSAALAEIIVGWDGVLDENEQPVPFSAEALDTLLRNYRPATLEIVTAWLKEMGASRLKN